MSYLNKVMLIGNVGKDIEVHNGPGHVVAHFSIATTRRYRDNNGETKEQTDWHNIVAFGKTVDTLQNLHVGKGTSLFVEGELHNRSWTDQATGQKRYATEVTLVNFQLLGSRSQNGSQGSNPYAPKNNQAQGTAQAPEQDNGFGPASDDDLPF